MKNNSIILWDLLFKWVQWFTISFLNYWFLSYKMCINFVVVHVKTLRHNIQRIDTHHLPYHSPYSLLANANKSFLTNYHWENCVCTSICTTFLLGSRSHPQSDWLQTSEIRKSSGPLHTLIINFVHRKTCTHRQRLVLATHFRQQAVEQLVVLSPSSSPRTSRHSRLLIMQQILYFELGCLQQVGGSLTIRKDVGCNR